MMLLKHQLILMHIMMKMIRCSIRYIVLEDLAQATGFQIIADRW